MADQVTDIAPAPPELLAKLTVSRERHEAAADVELDTPFLIQRALEKLERTEPAIEGNGGDAHTYKVIAAIRDMGISRELAETVLENWNARCVPPWDPDELAVKCDNAYQYAQNDVGARAEPDLLKIFAHVHAEDYAPDKSDDDGVAAYPTPLSASELASGTFPRTEHVWHSFIYRGLVNLLYGDGGTGKTLLAEHLAVAVAAGLPLFGHSVEQMPVLLVLAEDDNGETKARLEAITFSLGVKLADLPITLWALPGYDTTLARVADDGAWKPSVFWGPLRERLTGAPPSFVVLDSLADIFALNESQRLAANTAIKQVLGSLCRDFKATILAIAHPSKASMQDGTGYAGSTAWNNAVRNRLTLQRVEEKSPRRILSVAKTNYTGEGELDLVLTGMTFALAGSLGEAERAESFHRTCVTTAIKAAEMGAPIQRQRKCEKWVIAAIAKSVGKRPTDHEVKDELGTALSQGELHYVKGGQHRMAGYYPPDEREAEELAKAAKRGTESGSRKGPLDHDLKEGGTND